MSDRANKARRDAFCCWYVMLGNAAEAAEKAGFPKVRKTCLFLFHKQFKIDTVSHGAIAVIVGMEIIVF